MVRKMPGKTCSLRRRRLLNSAVMGAPAAAAALVATPAIAQSAPHIRWRMASSFPKSLDTLYGAGEYFAKRVAMLTDNNFNIRVFAAGEVVPGLQVLDAVENGTVECGHTASGYYVGKDPTFGFDTSMPFGLNARQHNAWVRLGGGQELMRELYQEYSVVSFLIGHTGAQMGGWWRKQIHTPDDLKGIKMRIGGFSGQVMARLGVIPQQIAAGDIYSALEKGSIDAVEFVGPYDDRKLGFAKVAPFYYYPAWWEGDAALSLYVGAKPYQSLPSSYREAIAVAASDTALWSIAKYDVENPKALRELVAAGVKLSPFSQPILEAAFAAAQEVYAQTAARNPKFKRVYESWSAFRRDQVTWFRVSEYTFDNFMARLSAAGRL